MASLRRTRGNRFCAKGAVRSCDKSCPVARQYWETNFSAARVKGTRAMLDALLERCDLEEVTTDRIAGLIARQESPIDEGTRWLLVSMTEQVLDGSASADGWPRSRPVTNWGVTGGPGLGR
jgi:hypothetical protein